MTGRVTTVNDEVGDMTVASVNKHFPGSETALDLRRETERSQPYRWGFVLFLLVNAVLFLRPAEIVPSLELLPIYEVLIVGALLLSLPVVLEQLSFESLCRHPVTLFVVAFLFAILFSNLAQLDRHTARKTTESFLKVVLYFLLLVGLVRSPSRFRTLMKVLLVLLLTIAILSLLRYEGIIDVLKIEAHVDNRGEENELGERTTFNRLMATGIFADPNDFSLVLVTGILICAKFLLEQKRMAMRLVVAAPLAVFMYGVVRTYSRGGFLALLAGVGVLLVSRFGMKRALPLVVLVIPAIALAVGGRQINIDFSDDEDTAAGRVEIWYDGLYEMRTSPVFGIGAGQMNHVFAIVAHNSFIHAYVETGILGGTLFLAMFYLPVSVLWRLRDRAALGRMHPVLREWRPYVLAVLVAYAVGLSSLSRSYVVSTYLVVGIGAAFMRMLAEDDPSNVPPMTLDLAKRLAFVSLCFLVCSYAFIKVVLTVL